MNFVRAGVIGHPIHHSKSPMIHNHWIKVYGLNGEYTAIDIAPQDLKGGVQKLITDGFLGFNVTIPHKETIMEICDDIDDTAQKIGAVNTVKIENGKMKGFNTDAFGFIANIKSQIPNFDFGAGKIIVLGAGGAARAVLYGLLQEGAADIIVTNRTMEKAQMLCKLSPNIKPVPWDEKEKYLKDATLLVNTTALGMVGKEPLILDLKNLPPTCLVNDIVYAPLMTDLLTAAKARGNPIVTGIGMLLHQARPAFEKWFGILPEVEAELLSKVLK